MKMTYIAIAVASLMMGGGVALAANSGTSGTNIGFNNTDATLDGEKLAGSYDATYERIVNVTDNKTHTITGKGFINWTHDDAPEMNGSIYASGKESVLNVKADGLIVTVKNRDAKEYPNLIHAMGATVNIETVNDVVLSSTGDGGALMSQAIKGVGSSLLSIKSTSGSVSIESDSSAVMAQTLNTDLSGMKSELVINAAKNVTISSARSAAVLLRDNAGPYTGDSGDASVNIHAGEVLTIKGGNALLQNFTNAHGSSASSTTLSAGKAINMVAGSTAVYVNSATSGKATTRFVAPEVSIETTSEDAASSAVKVMKKSEVTFGDGQTQSVVNLTANKGSAVDVTGTDSAVNFQRSTVNTVGSVKSAGKITLTDTTVNLGDGSTFQTNVLDGSGSSIVVGKVAEGTTAVDVTANNIKNLQVGFTGAANDQYATTDEAAQALASATKITNGADGSYTFSGQSGAVSDGWTADATGRVLTRTGNEAMSAVGNFNAMTLVQWRSEGNHIVQRLGDVRDGSGKVGAWARVYGYDSSYSDGISMDFKANSIQAGGDYRVNDAWLVGGAFSYTDGEGAFSNGSSDSDGYSLAAYLSGFFNCGAYVDVVGRVGRLSTDITAASQSSVFKGSYDNTTFGLSAEVGYHWSLTQTFYVEPQAELTYGFVKGDDFTGTNGVSISQDDFQTLVGRLGARVGASFADGAGTVYAHVSVNHDFLGDADFTATSGASRDFSVDLGGTWFSYGVGAQFNTSKNINFYGVLERSNGSEYDEDYRYGVGMRYAF